MNSVVLIVEDTVATREMVCEFLTSKNYTTLQAGDGLEAIEVLKKEHVDVVLTDIRMPNMNGFELIKVIRDQYPLMGIVVMTAFSSVYVEGNVLESGIDDYIAKPFSFMTLESKIERVILQTSMLKAKQK